MRNKLRTFLGFMIWGWLILTLIISVGYHLFFQQEREARINDLLNQLNAIQNWMNIEQIHLIPIKDKRSLLSVHQKIFMYLKTTTNFFLF